MTDNERTVAMGLVGLVVFVSGAGALAGLPGFFTAFGLWISLAAFALTPEAK